MLNLRSKVFFSLKAFGLLLLILVPLLILKSRLFGKPKLVLPLYSTHLGTGKPGETLSDVFRLANEGAAPLEFSLKASCGCSVLSPQKGTIPAGGTHDIRIGIHLAEYGEKSVQVTVESNDESAKTATHVVAATCEPIVSVQPRAVDFGPVDVDQPAEREFLVAGSKSVRLQRLEDVRITSAPPGVTVKKLSVTPRGVQFSVKLASPRPEGHFSGIVGFSVASAKHHLTLPVTAEVRGAASAAPAILRLKIGQDKKTPVNAVFLVRRNDEKPLGRLVRSDTPPALQVSEGQAISEKIRKFHLTSVKGEWPRTDTEISLTFEDLKKPVIVKVLPPNESDGPITRSSP